MIESLLVPLDGSEFSERSLPLARGLARATGARLHLAHVHVPHPPDHFLSNTQFHYEGLDLEEYDRHHREQEAAYLEEVAGRLADVGTVEVRLLEGEAAQRIADYAREVDADMIVITTHGHTGVSRMWLGSVADELVRRTHLPLLVIHPSEGHALPDAALEFRHILVPLDGSTLAEAILGPAVELAQAAGARMTLAHVLSATAVLGARIFPLLPDDVRTAKERASAYLEEVAERLRGEGLAVDTLVVEHEVPARGICRAARESEADLIAIATHGYGGFKRALLGSVADKVLRGSPLPLLLERPASAE